MRRALERFAMRLRGIDIEEMEREWHRMDEAKERREAERAQNETDARRRYVEARMHRGSR